MGVISRHETLLPITGSEWEGVRYGCTTRAGGVSHEPWGALNLATHVGDDPVAVAENRLRLLRELPAQPYWLNQVHGCRVVAVSDSVIPELPPDADAAVTALPGVVLAIMTADCLPIVIADTEGRAVGVAHAGWRGLASGVLEATVSALRSLLPDSDSYRAWVGPCISQKHFEVGEEVREAFVTPDATTAPYFAPGRLPQKWQADLSAIARHRLVKVGVQSVEISGLCTYKCDKLFHSYRRDPVCGRMATVAWLPPNNQR